MNKNILFTGTLAAMLLILAGCKKENNTNQTTVFVSTSDITNIQATSATGGGDVDLAGTEAITERGFVWATNPKPTTADNKVVAAGTGVGHFTAEITGLPAGTTYYLRAYVINNGETHYGNEVKPEIEMITNGDFSQPEDGAIVDINAVPGWKTDETSANVGRKPDFWDGSNFIAETNDWSKSIYQVIGKVPAVKSDYAISFDRNWYWTDWGDYKPAIEVIFSAYSGNDPQTRVPIGKVRFEEEAFFPGWGNNWAMKTGTFTIEAGSQYADQNLVVELDVIPYDDGSSGWDPNLWYHFDNVSVRYKP